MYILYSIYTINILFANIDDVMEIFTHNVAINNVSRIPITITTDSKYKQMLLLML